MSIKINRVYTRSGDGGKTGLVGGDKVSKASPRVSAYGSIDELNSHIGKARSLLKGKTLKLDPILEYLQHELFDVGAQVATPASKIPDSMWKVNEDANTRLEKLCDEFGERLPELESFILPGGSELASELHIARTVCRRAEREFVSLLEEEERGGASEQTSHLILVYLNRLSDALFVLARWALDAEGKSTPLWVPAGKRSL